MDKNTSFQIFCMPSSNTQNTDLRRTMHSKVEIIHTSSRILGAKNVIGKVKTKC